MSAPTQSDRAARESFPSVERGTGKKPVVLWSEDAERAVLAAMLLSPDAALLAPTVATADMFYREGHRAVFAALQRLQVQGVTIDPVTLANGLAAAGDLARAGGKEFIGQLLDEVPTGANVAHHAAIVRDFAERRRLLELARTLSVAATDVTVSLDAVRDSATAGLLHAVSGTSDAGFKPASSGVRKVLQRLQDIEAGVTTSGLLTGLPELDERLDGGFQPGDLVLVVGVPSSGKSSLMINVLYRLAVEGVGATALVSAEMPEEVVIRGVLSGMADVPASHIKRGSLTPEEARRVVAASGTLSRAPFHVDDADTPTIEDVVVRCTLLKARFPHLVAIGVDFLQMIQRRERERGESEELALEKTAYDLKGLAKRLGVVVFAAVQPNDKQVEDREDKRPQLRDIARSSGPRRACDAALLIYRPGQYSASAGPAMEINIGKQRTGALGRVELEWEGPYVRVTSKRRRQYEAELEAERTRQLNLDQGMPA
jgi:replicative DNA helicase